MTSLGGELRAVEASSAGVFKPPPTEWVAERLTRIGEVLEADTVQPALALHRALGPVHLVPIPRQVGQLYYQAETAVRVLDLLETPDGSNLLRWWRRWESNPRPETLSSRHLHQ